MKSLFYTVLIFACAFLAYDYFLAPPGQKIVFKDLNPPPKQPVAPTPVAHAPVTPEKMPEAKPAPAPAPAPEPAKPMTTVEAPKPAPATEAKPTMSKGPKFDPIEKLTGNWMKIPPTAFPREITLKQDTLFKMSVGGSKITAGAKVFVLAAENGQLTLAPTPTSPARALVPLDSTDLKERLNEAYEKWKVVRAEELRQLAAKKQQLAAAKPVEPPSTENIEANGKPTRDADGSYPLLVASMRRGQVTEITLEHILNWQEPQPVRIQGKNGWAVKVNCEVKTIFGFQPVEAQALVLDGKVTGWFYTGSGEEVP